MLMVDWYALRGGHNANPHCKRYFEVALDEESGGAFSSLATEKQQESSDDDDNTTSGGKRKPRARGGGKAGSKSEEAISGLVEAIKSTGTDVAAAISKMADAEKPTSTQAMVNASDLVDELEDKLEEEEEGKQRPRKIARIKANLKSAYADYEAAKRECEGAAGPTASANPAGAGGSDKEESDAAEEWLREVDEVVGEVGE